MNPFAAAGPRWFSIPANRPFLDDLALGLADPLLALGPDVLADAVVLVPNRRAARALAQSFVAATGAMAVLLPQIRALGDLEEGEPPFEPGDLALDLAPSISPLRRRFELARLVADHHKADIEAAAAIELGEALGGFFDSLEIEEVTDRSALADLVDAEFAEHWRVSAGFLSIAVDKWPARLAELGFLDRKAREVRLLRRLAEKWGDKDPGGVVVAAGSTGSTKATADLLITIANLRQGAVVLPGLDAGLADKAWRDIDEQHPQSALKRLIERAGIGRDIPEWRPTADASGRWRRRVVNEALRPAEATDDWRAQIARLKAEAAAESIDPIAEGLAGLSTISAANEEETAAVCALLLREALETDGKTAAVITPDPALARRVSARLSRWDITADSSAGSPLADCPTGVLISLLARAALDPISPVLQLAILKHPFCKLGSDWDRRILEEKALRGARPCDRDQLFAKLDKAGADTGLAAALVDAIHQATAPFANRPVSVAIAVRALIHALEAVASPQDLWSGPGGEAAASLLTSLMEDGAILPPVNARAFATLVEQLLTTETVRLTAALHPRLQILGALEGRLIGADRLILAGLEEGVWPPNAPTDPFLSRPMRKALGLPPPERRVGLSAHDFAQAACANEVVLVHSERRAGQPSVKSRWLWRLETLARGADLTLPRRSELIAWAHSLDEAGPPEPARRPAPKPPIEHRPKEWHVTGVETLVRDPYAIWARRILKLRAMDPPDMPMDVRIRGTAIHTAFEELAALYEDGAIPDARTEFERLYMDALDKEGLPASARPREQALAGQAAAWVAKFEERRREDDPKVFVERSGSMTFRVDGIGFTLSAKTDRLEQTADGYAHVLDFKTGAAPSKAQVEQGFSPQLTLTAAILSHGRFEGLPSLKPGELVYVQVTGRNPAGLEIVRAAKDESLEAGELAFAGLINVMRRYNDPNTPYLSRVAPQFVKTYASDYDHLARVYEWSSGGDEGGDE